MTAAADQLAELRDRLCNAPLMKAAEGFENDAPEAARPTIEELVQDWIEAAT